MSVLKRALYLFLLLKPFYFFESGSLQIGDFVFLSTIPVFLLISRKNRTDLIKLITKNRFFILFIFSAISINILYFIQYSSFDFLKSSLYYIYNFSIILEFSFLFLKDKNSLVTINKIMKINLVVQSFILVTGIGRYYDSFRYMGTFNDPNQFAYFILISYSFIYLLSYMENKKSLLWILVSLILIVASGSTGMLLGLCTFIVLYVIKNRKHIMIFFQSKKRQLLLICAIIFLLAPFVYLILPRHYLASRKIFNIDHVTERVEQKIDKASNHSKLNLFEERGYDRIYYYPYYVFFGAGQGADSRWAKATLQNEIHATFPSILFYYGIIPLIILLYWIYSHLKNLDKSRKVIYIALFIESFTLLNQRQPLFWLIIILGSFLSLKKGDFYDRKN